MALDRNNRNYYYNLGRCVAIVEIMNELPKTFRSLVFDNAFEKLPFQLNEALAKDKHNLHDELMSVAEVILADGNEFPKGLLTAYDTNGSFWIGLYHEGKYLDDTYHDVYGNAETVILDNIPEQISPIASNKIEELVK